LRNTQRPSTPNTGTILSPLRDSGRGISESSRSSYYPSLTDLNFPGCLSLRPPFRRRNHPPTFRSPPTTTAGQYACPAGFNGKKDVGFLFFSITQSTGGSASFAQRRQVNCLSDALCFLTTIGFPLSFCLLGHPPHLWGPIQELDPCTTFRFPVMKFPACFSSTNGSSSPTITSSHPARWRTLVRVPHFTVPLFFLFLLFC